MVEQGFREVCDNIKEMVSKTQFDIMMSANTKLINLYIISGKN